MWYYTGKQLFMEKSIVLVSNGQVDMPAIDMGCYLAKLTHSWLTGLFVQDIHFELVPDIQIQKPYFKAIKEKDAEQETIVKMEIEQSMRLFKDACDRREVNSKAYEVKGDPLKEVVHESRFADVLIIDPKTTFSKRLVGIPTHFVREVMVQSECPVVIAPDIFEGIDEVCFCYDGSRSSMFAMKQFTHLFSQYQTRKVTLLEIKKSEIETVGEDERRVLSWLKRHYDIVDPHVVRGDAKGELVSYFLQKKNVFIVMGAYGRNALSYFFKRSSADMILRVINLPLFVAHG